MLFILISPLYYQNKKAHMKIIHKHASLQIHFWGMEKEAVSFQNRTLRVAGARDACDRKNESLFLEEIFPY